MQESFVDLKENQRSIAEKDTSCGVLHIFQRSPEGIGVHKPEVQG